MQYFLIIKMLYKDNQNDKKIVQHWRFLAGNSDPRYYGFSNISSVLLRHFSIFWPFFAIFLITKLFVTSQLLVHFKRFLVFFDQICTIYQLWCTEVWCFKTLINIWLPHLFIVSYLPAPSVSERWLLWCISLRMGGGLLQWWRQFADLTADGHFFKELN